MFGKHRVPVLSVMETDDHEAGLLQSRGDLLIQPDLLWRVVVRAVDVDRRVALLIEEVGPCRTRLDEKLRVTRWDEHQPIQRIKPSLFQLAVASLAEAEQT